MQHPNSEPTKWPKSAFAFQGFFDHLLIRHLIGARHDLSARARSTANLHSVRHLKLSTALEILGLSGSACSKRSSSSSKSYLWVLGRWHPADASLLWSAACELRHS